jgi:hypothetical protein
MTPSIRKEQRAKGLANLVNLAREADQAKQLHFKMVAAAKMASRQTGRALMARVAAAKTVSLQMAGKWRMAVAAARMEHRLETECPRMAPPVVPPAAATMD